MAKENKAKENQPVDNEVEKSPEEMKAESDAATAAFQASRVEKSEKSYSRDEVQMMIAQAIKTVRNEDYNADRPEEHKKDSKTARLSRFTNKFIVALKNMNTDEYSKDEVIFTWDVWDDRVRQNIPWVTLSFQDGTEIAQPLATVIKKSVKVPCEIVKVYADDKSYSTGTISKLNDDGQPTGETTQGRVEMVTNRWDLKIPNTGEIVNVGPEVLNW